MIYDISHRTAYGYSLPVTQSQHVLHLAPRDCEYQSIKRHSLLIEPAPTTRRDYVDYFGNPYSILSIDEEHSELVIHARSTIEVLAQAVEIAGGTPFDAILPHLLAGGASNHATLDLVDYATPSPETPTSPAVLEYALPSFAPGTPVLKAAWDLTCRIFADFKFDPTATDVSTPVAKTLADRRGVCQDFAHLALACLRSMMVPARYVSGYLLTKPPEGKPKLQGADASHAWIAVWSPEEGWVGFDPTNRVIVSDEHIAFAFGREYSDISPISGVLLGGGSHTVSVAVDVRPLG